MRLPSCTKPQGFDSHKHSFRSKVLHKQVTCHYCRLPISRLGSSCRICKYICHPECQPRVALTCENSQVTYYRIQNYESSNVTTSPLTLPQHYQQYTLPKSHSLPFSRHFMYHTTYRVPDKNDDLLTMDLIYITERVIVMTFPLVGNEKVYRENLREVTQMLKTKHGDHYMIFNLSEKRYDISRLNRQVLDFGWPDRLAPPLERLCSICKSIDSWLNSDPQHIVVLHSKGGKERVGIVTEAYRHYSSICASNDQALDRFAMKRFYDDKIGNLSQPSQKRYIKYFSGLLSGAIKINSSPLYLNHVTIIGVPNYDGKGGCKAFLKVYQGMHQIYSSGIYNITSNMGRVFLPLEIPLQLRGDIMLKCYHKARSTTREVIFRCQFHTCAIVDHLLTLAKEDLDDASQDKRFPEDGRVEVRFSSGPHEYRGNGYEIPHPVESSTDPVVRWDSYENFDLAPEDNPETLDDLEIWTSSKHTEGPVDGNLYATVSKRKPYDTSYSDTETNGIHTISMDSGISSQAIPNGTLSSSQSPIIRAEIHRQPTKKTPDHAKLDDVLNGMLLGAQSMPDIKPSYATYTLRTSSHQIDKIPSLVSADRKRETYVASAPATGPSTPTMEDDGPYHASKNSRPFTYLVPSSPSAERKNLGYHSTPALELRRVEDPPVWDRVTPDPDPDDEFSGDPEMWLQNQQRKLRERKEAKVYADRHHREQRVIHELRHSRRQQPEWLDDDSYLSDTLASLEAFSSREMTPLHVNTYNGYTSSQSSSSPYVSKPPIHQQGRASAPASPLIPNRTSSRDVRVRYNVWPSQPQPQPQPQPQTQTQLQAQPQSRPVQRQRSDTSHDRERPFVVVKRAHEQAKKEAEPGYPSYGQSLAYSAYTETVIGGTKPLATSSPAGKYHDEPLVSPGLLTTMPAPSKPVGSSRLIELEKSLQAVSTPTSVRQQPDIQTRHYPDVQAPNRYYPGSQTQTPQYPETLTPSCPSYPETQPTIRPTYMETQTTIRQTYPEIQPTIRPTYPGTSSRPAYPDTQTTVRPTYPESQITVHRYTETQTPVRRYPESQTLVRSTDPRYKPGDTVDSSGSWNYEDGRDEDRPITPGFPVQPRTPYFNRAPSPATGLPPKSPTTSRRALPGGSSASRPQLRRWPSSSSSASTNTSKDRSPSPGTIYQIRSGIVTQQQTADPGAQPTSQPGQSTPSVYYGQSRRNSLSSLTDTGEIITHAPTFMKDTSKFWYKPNISREDAINMLKDKLPGSFVVRDSNSFPGAYGMALKVATPPPNVQNKSGDMTNELVRHFLIEPTNHGVRLKGCVNEPVFGSLSALVYQHSITPMALPCKLLLPDTDMFDALLSDVAAPSSAAQLLTQGAACNVLYLYSVDIELLTGPEAVRKAVAMMLQERPLPKATVVHFKVSSQGITVTDNNRKLFFRRHYPVNGISHCGLDPGDRRWTQYDEETRQAISTHRIFGYVAAKQTDPSDNYCHIFAELEPEQPAFAIVNFVTKVMMTVPSQNGTVSGGGVSVSGGGSVSNSVTFQRKTFRTAMSPEDAAKCCD